MTEFIPGKLYKTAQQIELWDGEHLSRFDPGVLLMFVKEEPCSGHDDGYHDYLFLLEDRIMTLCHDLTGRTSINFLFWGPLK